MIVPQKILQAAIRAYFGEAYSAQTPTAIDSVRDKLTPVIQAAFEEAAKNETNLFFGDFIAEGYINEFSIIERAQDAIRRSYARSYFESFSRPNRRLQAQLDLPIDSPLAMYIVRNHQSGRRVR